MFLALSVHLNKSHNKLFGETFTIYLFNMSMSLKSSLTLLAELYFII
jgi:hypothetical protein